MINMVDKEDKIADRTAESIKRDRRLDEEQSNENPDKVEVFNRQSDRKREQYVKDNFDDSVMEGETERRYGPQ